MIKEIWIPGLCLFLLAGCGSGSHMKQSDMNGFDKTPVSPTPKLVEECVEVISRTPSHGIKYWVEGKPVSDTVYITGHYQYEIVEHPRWQKKVIAVNK